MSQLFDIESWDRKEHFHFFKNFEEPFFGVTFDVDVTYLYNYVKGSNISFYIAYLYAALKTANEIKEFRLRIRGNDIVVLHHSIGASPTVYRPNGTFGFAHIDYHTDFFEFSSQMTQEIKRVEADNRLISVENDDNTIHFSVLPWIKFTAISHARSFSLRESIPKISFGKIYEQNMQKLMPVSVHVNHAIMDGYHVGLFAEKFQEQLNQELEKKKTV
ncbi:CatA-like O-acetyltransferase [Ascidiimonas sp. W6]|uniref:CatA-like O-acetyltransferase n=1 Tax=Ascidiimonas meishanensis TaxID=3128903 RepID=UPI0030EE2481